MPVFRTVKDARTGNVRLEAIHQPLFDSASITASATISFFQNPAGRPSIETNLPTAGQLSWPKRFSIRALRQVAAPGLTLFTDFASFLSKASYKVVVGEKQYLSIPAFLLTAGTGLEAPYVTGAAAPAAPANGQTYVNHGRPEQRNIYSLLHSIYIPPVQNFSVTLDIASGFTAGTAFRLWLFLEGELLREIQ
jgi:hypothetical protein